MTCFEFLTLLPYGLDPLSPHLVGSLFGLPLADDVRPLGENVVRARGGDGRPTEAHFRVTPHGREAYIGFLKLGESVFPSLWVPS